MRKYILLLIFIGVSNQGFSQTIETDIFGNLQYESKDGIYKSHLKKNIFNDLVYSDSRDNEVTLTKKYLDLHNIDLLENKEAELDIFRSMIRAHRRDVNYIASYSVDIFDKTIIEDNRNSKIEIGKDIFGNETYEEKNHGQHLSIKRNLNGGLEYKSNNEEAKLQKDIFNSWIYEDSSGNEFKFSVKTWQILENRFGTEENIFYHLVHDFLRM